MEQSEFLEKNVFTDLKNLNTGTDIESAQYFSEADFKIILERVEHYGIGIYSIDTKLKGELYASSTHNDFKKKATDSKWYKKAFSTFTTRHADLSYTATYKVSTKLLARQNILK